MSREDILRRLADITPDQLSAYLTLRGWSNDGSIGSLASIWHRPEPQQKDVEILLPIAVDAKDFKDRLYDAVDALGAYEARSPIDVISDVLGHFADRIRVRVFHIDVEGGTIPLDDGVLLNERARDLMEAAACASLSKRRQFMGRKPEEATEYIKTLRLGQTEIGSYVVNIIAPMPPQETNQLGLPSIPIANLVTATLSSGLRALDSAIQTVSNSGNTVAYDEAVNNGVSANLCDALVGLSGANIRRGFEVVITPAGASAEVNPVSTFLFDRDKVERVAEAAAYYKREDYTLQDRTITGSIEKLDRPVAEQRGTVTIATVLNGQHKNVSVELDENEYQQAVDAHGRKDVVQCSGDVRVTARAARLINAHGFRVIRNGELL